VSELRAVRDARGGAAWAVVASTPRRRPTAWPRSHAPQVPARL